MISFRYERTGDGLGCLVTDGVPPHAEARSDSFADALAQLVREAGTLRAVAVSLTGDFADAPAMERLLQLGLPVCAVISLPVGHATLAAALRCHRRICIAVDGLRLGLADPRLPFLGEPDGVSVAEAVAAGVLDAVAQDVAAALELARAWASTAERPEGAPFLPQEPSPTGHASGRVSAGIRAVSSDLNDGYAARVFGSFLVEGLALLGEGVPAATIEEAALDAGFAAGPLAALDAAGLAPIDAALHRALDGHGHAHGHVQDDGHAHDHGHGHGHGHDHDHGHACSHEHEHDHAHGHQCRDHGHDHSQARSAALPPIALPKPAVHVVEKMAHGFRRAGRAAGAGFYQYAEGERAELWSGLAAFKRRAASATPAEIGERLLFAMAVEARRSLGDLSPRLGDVVSLYGCGFPLSTRGAIGFGTGAGAQAFDARCEELAAKHGERFRPQAGERADADAPSHAHGHAHSHEHEPHRH